MPIVSGLGIQSQDGSSYASDIYSRRNLAMEELDRIGFFENFENL